jgi:hypothetical protein
MRMDFRTKWAYFVLGITDRLAPILYWRVSRNHRRTLYAKLIEGVTEL